MQQEWQAQKKDCRPSVPFSQIVADGRLVEPLSLEEKLRYIVCCVAQQAVLYQILNALQRPSEEMIIQNVMCRLHGTINCQQQCNIMAQG